MNNNTICTIHLLTKLEIKNGKLYPEPENVIDNPIEKDNGINPKEPKTKN